MVLTRNRDVTVRGISWRGAWLAALTVPAWCGTGLTTQAIAGLIGFAIVAVCSVFYGTWSFDGEARRKRLDADSAARAR
ncbi:hypothetical protein [Gordonia sp. (in: high G+C Gram-positive bacteria)]|uniref:hypothetical protein n=1 Tax=Gordonia sp. (in: high G+C Gram-positive bacteria) TaxID=84139 RepID=UPI00352753E7